jgi:hypothetical protein
LLLYRHNHTYLRSSAAIEGTNKNRPHISFKINPQPRIEM